MKAALTFVLGVLALCPAISVGQPNPHALRSLDFEMMTWPEVKKAIESGKTTALVYNGGTE
jgi:creatinine amidohydrolase